MRQQRQVRRMFGKGQRRNRTPDEVVERPGREPVCPVSSVGVGDVTGDVSGKYPSGSGDTWNIGNTSKVSFA